jgi:hypothetical protein
MPGRPEVNMDEIIAAEIAKAEQEVAERRALQASELAER